MSFGLGILKHAICLLIRNIMDKISFGTFCCMLMKEFCKKNSLDVIVFSQWLTDNIRIMNERIGRC